MHQDSKEQPAGRDLTTADLTVGDLGEDALLAQVFPLLPDGFATLLGPGDDAAVLAAPDGRVVVSTDLLVEGRHFRRAWSQGYDVGRRAAAQNLADVAAMGARPTALVVGLVLPRDVPVSWVLDLARGLSEACAPGDVGVVGGDLSGGDELVVSVTVLGDLEGRAPVLRSGARPGDVLAHAGVRGHSAGGLAHLQAAEETGSPGGAFFPRAEAGRVTDGSAVLRAAYLRPDPPLAAGIGAAEAGATAMLDVSDGLLRDAGRLARASGVVLDLADPTAVFAEDLRVLAPTARLVGVDPVLWVLTGGEDHGMLATFASEDDVPASFQVIGRVLAPDDTAPKGTVLVEGAPPAVSATGWDHFRR